MLTILYPKCIFGAVRLSKFNANELRSLKKDSYQNSNLWTGNSNVKGLIISRIRIGKIK